MSKDTSGQAFPRGRPGHDGMTLRDWFAGQALAALSIINADSVSRSMIVRQCYAIADAMIEARIK